MSDDKDFEKCKELMRGLIFLSDNGKNDSEEADVIRDELEGYWYGLTLAQQVELRQMSIEAQK